MSYYQLKLLAGQRYKQDAAGCKVLLIDDLGAASSVDVILITNGAEGKSIPNRKTSFKLVQAFDGAVFTASVDTTLSVFLSPNEVDLGFRDGTVVLGSISIVNTPDVHVTNSVTVGNNDVTAIPVRNQILNTVVNLATVTAGLAEVALVSDATLKQVRVRNNHATASIAIGPTGVTMANGAVHLGPGEMWIEDSAPGIAWCVISDTAATPVQIQTVK